MGKCTYFIPCKDFLLTKCSFLLKMFPVRMKIETTQEIGALIRSRRKLAKLSIAGLAELIPCSPRLLGEVERGKRNVSLAVVLNLCAALGIDLFAEERKGDER